MKLLSQRDPRWSAIKLGASQLTVGRYGCTTTCLSMLSDYFGGFLSPADIAPRASWYTPDGLVNWEKLDFSNMKFSARYKLRNDDVINYALKDPNRAVMLNVSGGSHWVVALRKTLFGNSYICADPWDATKVDVIKKYGDVTGCAVFVRK